jgi:uncharacterized protein
MKGLRNKSVEKKESRPPRVSLDTEVLLRALLLGDAKSTRLRQAWQQGAFQPLIAATGAQALMRALAYPGFKLGVAQQHELLADFLPYAEVVNEAAKAARPPSSCAPALSLVRAEMARADFLVSDCVVLRASYARLISRSGKAGCRLLDSDQFLASL